MEKGTLLLASSGKEFTKPTGILGSSSEVKKARKEAMGRLGLDFLESVGANDDMDIEKELAADEDGDVDMENGANGTNGTNGNHREGSLPISPTEPVKSEARDSPMPAPSKSPTPAPTTPVPDDSTLSARERNRLKRKRKAGNSAFVGAPPTQGVNSKYTPMPGGQGNK